MTDAARNFVIGLTGSLGSGCSTLSRALESKGFKRISLADPIKDKFRELYSGMEPTKDSFGEDWRAELQDIGNKGRQGEYIQDNTGGHKDYWINLALKAVEGHQGDIVIDGIRNSGEVEALREKYPHMHFWLVAVYADYEKRYERVRERYQNEEVFKRDDLRDSNEDERFGQNVQKCVYEADFVFKNKDPIQPNSIIAEKLAEKLMPQVSLMKGEGEPRNPTIPEVSMATAVSQSNASRCLKRKVGALIVDENNNIPLSVGYNDNPVGMLSCVDLDNGQCYKDMIMETKLEEMGPLYCPKCAKKHETLSKPWICDGFIKIDKGEKPCRYNFKLNFFPSRNIELCTAIHAEERAIRSLGGRSAEGCTLYVNTFPCFQCSRYIKDADIKKVVYVEAYPVKEAVDFLKNNDIIIEAFEGFKPRVFNQVFKQIE